MNDNPNSLIRLNKVLAQAGVSSRRGADDLIKQGKVKINGQIITEPGLKVDPGQDIILVNGQKLPASEKLIYIKIYKPTQVVSTVKDPQGRKTVLELLPEKIRDKRLYPVGRLDYFSEGLLLLTNDGQLTQKMLHPSFSHKKVYRIWVKGQLNEQRLNIMRTGMTLSEGEKLAPVQAKILKQQKEKFLLELTLVQGLNRQIRRMCRDLQLTILQLKRISHASLHLGNMHSGQWQELTAQEINTLQKMLA